MARSVAYPQRRKKGISIKGGCEGIQILRASAGAREMSEQEAAVGGLGSNLSSCYLCVGTGMVCENRS